jgi:hypothetical protein
MGIKIMWRIFGPSHYGRPEIAGKNARMQAGLWGSSLIAFGLAGLSVFAERRRSKRTNLDHAGFMPWDLVLVLSLMAGVTFAALALKS